MKLLIAVEHHFVRGKDGGVYTLDPIQWDFFASHLGTFSEIVVLARVKENHQNFPPELRADGPNVRFVALPDYRGPWQFVGQWPELRKRARAAIAECDAFLLRLPGVVGGLVRQELRGAGKEFGVHVVGDPREVFAPHASTTGLRRLYRWVFSRQLRQACAEARAVAYVSSHVLPDRYPASPEAATFVFSNVMLKGALLSPAEAEARAEKLAQPGRMRVGTIASLQVPYKGIDVLLRAVGLCAQKGIDLSLTVVGEGALRSQLEAQGRELGIAKRTVFAGQVPAGGDIYRFLDGLDLYVQPSRTEGLPRALIEAMARGCPAIGSAVGGIPELLAADEMVKADDPRALADKMAERLSDPGRLAAMSRKNVVKAAAYDFSVIQESRAAFLRALAGAVEGKRTACAG